MLARAQKMCNFPTVTDEAPIQVRIGPTLQAIDQVYQAARLAEPDKSQPAVVWLPADTLEEVAELVESLVTVEGYLTAATVRELYRKGVSLVRHVDEFTAHRATDLWVKHCYAADPPIGVAAIETKHAHCVMADALLAGMIGDLIAVGRLEPAAKHGGPTLTTVVDSTTPVEEVVVKVGEHVQPVTRDELEAAGEDGVNIGEPFEGEPPPIEVQIPTKFYDQQPIAVGTTAEENDDDGDQHGDNDT